MQYDLIVGDQTDREEFSDIVRIRDAVGWRGGVPPPPAVPHDPTS
jgi:hypothetical protein